MNGIHIVLASSFIVLWCSLETVTDVCICLISHVMTLVKERDPGVYAMVFIVDAV